MTVVEKLTHAELRAELGGRLGQWPNSVGEAVALCEQISTDRYLVLEIVYFPYEEPGRRPNGAWEARYNDLSTGEFTGLYGQDATLILALSRLALAALRHYV